MFSLPLCDLSVEARTKKENRERTEAKCHSVAVGLTGARLVWEKGYSDQ